MRRFWLGLAITGCAALVPTGVWADDQELAQQIAQNFKNSGQLKGYSINVVVEDGIVHLNGRVSSADQLDRAISLAEVTPGIERVVNNLEIQSPPPKVTNSGLRQPNNLFASKAAAQAPTARQLSNPVQRVSAAIPTQPNYAVAPQVQMQRPMAQPRPVQYSQPMMASAPSRETVRPTGNTGKITYTNSTPAPRTVSPQGARPLGYPQLASNQVAGSGDVISAPGGLGMPGTPMPAHIPSPNASPAPAMYDSPNMPNYSWPSYAAYPNYAAVNYPKQYSATAWPYIGPFYPYPQVPLGWRKVTLEWDDGWWFLDFKD